MYTPTEDQDKRRQNNFEYHVLIAGQPERYVFIRKHAQELSRIFDRNCPPSRELSLAQTKLEEAVMWANAAIARNETKEQEFPT